MGALLSSLIDAYKSIKSVLTLLLSQYTDFNDALKRASKSPGLPTPNPTPSYWLQDPPYPELTDIQSEKLPSTADVAIIGSGITGAAIARSLLHERRRLNVFTDEKIIVLEARQLCSGATGRNGGHMKPSPYEVFSRFSKSMGEERAAAITRFQMGHVELLTGLCEEEGISVAEAREVETVDLFLEKEGFEKGFKEAEDMRKFVPEVNVKVWDGEKGREKFGVNTSIHGALSYRAGAIFPYRFVTTIWKRLLTAFPNTLSLETRTPVHSISTSPLGTTKGFPYTLHTPRGAIHVRHVVHATNSHAAHLVPGLRRKITGIKCHMTAQKPGKDFPDCKGNRSWSVLYDGSFDYVTQRPSHEISEAKDPFIAASESETEKEAGDLMLGGGWGRSAKQGLDNIANYDDSTLDGLTIAHLAGIFPAIFFPRWGAESQLKNVWSGIIGVTGDFLPMVGKLGHVFTGRNVEGEQEKTNTYGEWIAAGFCGDGMVWAWKCGVALGIMIAGSEREDLPEGPGQPGGRVVDWLPRELLVTEKRLESADVSHLADEL